MNLYRTFSYTAHVESGLPLVVVLPGHPPHPQPTLCRSKSLEALQRSRLPGLGGPPEGHCAGRLRRGRAHDLGAARRVGGGGGRGGGRRGNSPIASIESFKLEAARAGLLVKGGHLSSRRRGPRAGSRGPPRRRLSHPRPRPRGLGRRPQAVGASQLRGPPGLQKQPRIPSAERCWLPKALLPKIPRGLASPLGRAYEPFPPEGCGGSSLKCRRRQLPPRGFCASLWHRPPAPCCAAQRPAWP